MRSTTLHVVCICLLSAISAALGIAQERGLPEITIPVAPAQPTITATVSLITGPAPEVTAEAIQLGGDSGLTIMQGVSLGEAKAWGRPVPWALNVPGSAGSPIIEPRDEVGGEGPAAAAPNYSRAVGELLLERTPDQPDIEEALTRAWALYSKAAAPGSAPTQLSDVYGPFAPSIASKSLYTVDGVALKSESRELKPGEEQAVDLTWPDERPRYYLEQQDQNRYLRVELADREGYSVALRATRMGANLAVDMGLTRNTLAGGRYDQTIKAYVGKPTLIKTICQTSAPVTAGTATVVTWNTPSARGVDRAALARAQYQAGGAGTAAGMGSVVPSGAMPGLAIVLSAGPLPATNPPPPPAAESPDAPAVEPGEDPAAGPAAPAGGPPAASTESPDAPAAEPAAPVGAEPGEAEEVGAQVEVDLKFIEVPVGSVAWKKLGEGGAVALTTEPETLLEQFVGDSDVRVIAWPKLIALDNQRAEMQIGQVEPHLLGMQEGEVELGTHVAVTPRILPADGQVLLTLDARFDELLDKVQGVNADPSAVVGTREAKVVLRTFPGETAVLRGLVRMDQQTAEDGTTTKRPVETLILVTPRLLPEGVRK